MLLRLSTTQHTAHKSSKYVYFKTRSSQSSNAESAFHGRTQVGNTLGWLNSPLIGNHWHHRVCDRHPDQKSNVDAVRSMDQCYLHPLRTKEIWADRVDISLLLLSPALAVPIPIRAKTHASHSCMFLFAWQNRHPVRSAFCRTSSHFVSFRQFARNNHESWEEPMKMVWLK